MAAMPLPPPFPDTDLTAARLTATRWTPARKHVPGFWEAWGALADGSPLHWKAVEVRALNDLGFAALLLSRIEERGQSVFAQRLNPVPVFEQSRAGRIFAFYGPLDERFVARPLGELIAADLREADPAIPAPVPEDLAAPIPWDQAEPLLVSMRLLSIDTHAQDDATAEVRVRVGAPRGTYVLRGTGLLRLEEQGYPGDHGLASAERINTENASMVMRLHPGGKGTGAPPVEIEAGSWEVRKVKGE